MKPNELRQLFEQFLIHHYGTNEPKTLRDGFGVGGKVVDGQTIELVEFLAVGRSTNSWLFDDLVQNVNQFLAEQGAGVTASLTVYFLVRVHKQHTVVRARATVGHD